MSKNDIRILHIYYLLEIILFLIIKVAEQAWREPGQGDPGVPGSPLAILRYCAIICNFLMIIYLYLRYGRYLYSRENLIPLAFALTLTADCFMCIIAGKRILGYLFFTFVETVYMIYMKPTWRNISVRLILYSIIFLLLWRVGMLHADNAFAMANMVQLTVNLPCAWIRRTKIGGRETLLFALGITLFAGCDYAILVRTIAEQLLSTTHPIYTIAAFVVWTCYIPAQVLLLRSYVESIIASDKQNMTQS
ncbi:MAG: hypothetical protein J1F18_11265 [Lachnospiraceae bacterium]|nr:hypothetical protein [Lachnospiraceae bacterium]